MISVIMIVYNVEPYVRQGITSVLAQTYTDLEVIVVVGHGSDRSESICEELAAADPRIKLICGEAKGIADARNQGLAAATGDYIGFVDPDDYVEPDMFERMLAGIKAHDADISVCGRFYEYVNRTLADEPAEPVVLSAGEALSVTLSHKGFFLHCWDKLFARHLFDGIRFDTSVVVEDRIIVDRLLAKANRIVYDPTPLYHFRERSGSNSKKSGMISNNIEADRMMEDFFKKEFPALSNEFGRFMLYEYITAIQNELCAPHPGAEALAEYKKGVRAFLSKDNPLIPQMFRIKAYMALYTPAVLKLYTKYHLKKVSEELERFS